MIPRELIKKIRRIEIRTNRMVNDVLAGEYHSVFKGQGVEFEEVREYQAGDDIRTIDWNVTARMGEPFVKRYREERELTVMLVVDASSSGMFGTAEKMKSDLATELSALLAFSAIKNNDRVGLMLFTNQVEKLILTQKREKTCAPSDPRTPDIRIVGRQHGYPGRAGIHGQNPQSEKCRLFDIGFHERRI